jgi:hypothetical protein
LGANGSKHKKKGKIPKRHIANIRQVSRNFCYVRGYIHYKISQIQNEIVTFDSKSNSLGILFKLLLFFLGSVYLLRLISPFLFKLLFSSLAKKANQSQPQETKTNSKKKKGGDALGEYIDYEEVE